MTDGAKVSPTAQRGTLMRHRRLIGRRRNGVLSVFAGFAVATMVLSACGGGGGGGNSGGTTTSPTADLAALGAPNKASGAPVTIGMITEGGSEAIGSQAALAQQGADLAVKYVNDYRGGLAGWPISLFVCGNKSTPAGAQACANQMVDKKVAAVIWPFTGQGASVPIITGAHIPIIAVSGSSSEELTTPGVFILTGGYIATLGAYAKDAADRGFKKFAMVVIDVPAATQAAQTLGGQVFKKAGLKFDVITAAPGTPDLSPQLQQAVSSGADAIGVTGDVTFCTSFLKAYQTLSITTQKYVISTCTDQSVVKALPNALNGSIMAATASNTNSPDQKLYAAMIQKYAPGKGIDLDPMKSSGVAAGVSSVMDLSLAMNGLTGDPTPAAITQQVKTAKGKIFLGGGITFDCSSKPIPILPNICSAQLLVGKINSSGVLQNPKLIDPASLFAS